MSCAEPAMISGPYVLLVDDDRPTLSSLDLVVKLAGHRCVPVSSASSALRTCEVRVPHVVVTDLKMPNLDGRGLARQLRDRYPAVPIILITGEQLGPDSMSQLRRIFTAILPKPLAIESFLDCLGRIMPSPPESRGGERRP